MNLACSTRDKREMFVFGSRLMQNIHIRLTVSVKSQGQFTSYYHIS